MQLQRFGRLRGETRGGRYLRTVSVVLMWRRSTRVYQDVIIISGSRSLSFCMVYVMAFSPPFPVNSLVLGRYFKVNRNIHASDLSPIFQLQPMAVEELRMHELGYLASANLFDSSFHWRHTFQKKPKKEHRPHSAYPLPLSCLHIKPLYPMRARIFAIMTSGMQLPASSCLYGHYKLCGMTEALLIRFLPLPMYIFSLWP